MKFRTAVSVTLLLSLAATLSAVVSVVSIVLDHRNARRELSATCCAIARPSPTCWTTASRCIARRVACWGRATLKAVVATDDVTPPPRLV